MDKLIETLQALIQLKELELSLIGMLADDSWHNCHATILIELKDNRLNQALLEENHAHHRLNDNVSEMEAN